jgi:protein-S-isoprenylcysteine O-methyltransferase Ste14
VPSPTRRPSAAERAVAWGGAAAFAASLLYFLFSYDVTFTRDLDGALKTGDVAWDVVLFSLFALHHSLFARLGIRASVQRTFGALERSVYVWIASALLILVCAFWRPVAGLVWQMYGLSAWLLRLAHVFGVGLSVFSAASIDVWDLAGVRQVAHGGQDASAGSKKQDPAYTEEFKTTGPYGLVRHPIYLGWLLIVFAVPHMTMTRLVFAVISSLYVLIAIPLEERALLATTQGAYERYRKKVRFRLVPRLY